LFVSSFCIARLRYLCLLPLAACVAVFSLLTAANAADAPACPADIAASLATAREAVNATSPAADKDHALECLIEAVVALDAKVEGIRTGTVPLEGFINAQGGFRPKRYGKADQ